LQVYALPTGMAGGSFNLASKAADKLQEILAPKFAGDRFNLASAAEGRIGYILPDDFMGQRFDLAAKAKLNIDDAIPSHFAGNHFSAADMMQAAISTAMYGIGTGLGSSKITNAQNTPTKLPGFASGSNFIPYDMTANIHAGEEITPRPYVDMQRSARDETNALLEELIRSNRELKAELALIKTNTGNTATSSGKTARTMEAVTLGGTELRTKAV